MTAGELTEWLAWEQVNGPLLVHDRIDYGLAMIAFLIARTMGGSKRPPEAFLPPWHRGRPQRSDDDVVRGLEELFKVADANH